MDKTEIVIFRPKRKQITKNMNFQIRGLILDEHLKWSVHINILKKKLSRANGLLSKLRYSTSQNSLITIYYALQIFHMAFKYGANQIINEIVKLQRKTIRIIAFNNQFASDKILLKGLKILPFHKMIQMQNCLLVLSHLNNNLPGTLRDFFESAIN